MICICNFDRSVDVCSRAEEEVDYWREVLESRDLIRTLFEEQTDVRTWIWGLKCLIWLRVWLSFGLRLCVVPGESQ
jgi:hypothetical protein